jgi:hypothetical protein
MGPNVAKEVAAMERMTVPEMRASWRRRPAGGPHWAASHSATFRL